MTRHAVEDFLTETPEPEQSTFDPLSCYDGAGVIITDGPGGRVYMRLDDPGKYFNVTGNPVSEATARRAGFDTSKWRGEAQRRAIMDQARAKIAAHRRREEAPQVETTPQERLNNPEVKRLVADALKVMAERTAQRAKTQAKDIAKAQHIAEELRHTSRDPAYR